VSGDPASDGDARGVGDATGSETAGDATGSETTPDATGSETAADATGSETTPDATGSETAADATTLDATDTDGPLALSRQYLRAVRADEPTAAVRDSLAALPEDSVAALSESAATAFWLNVYNAATQTLLTDRPALYDSRVRFFRADAVTVAGAALSLDDVEHGLLRGRSKYGLGYLPRLLRSGFERRQSLSTPDPRLHFALNCGAASCPPVATYSADVDRELDLAAEGYLAATVDHDPEAGVVRVPAVCRWFRGDFGGPSGVRAMLREYDLLPAEATPEVAYLDWDWSRTRPSFREL